MRTLPTPEYAAFMDIFRTTIEAHRADGKQLGLLVLQIPKIEQVDRLLGMQKGEAFMLRVTRRLHEGVLRKNDRLGRISRDQFACLLPRIAGEGVAILAASKVLDALEMPVPIGDHSFDTDAVIGIALYPDHGDNPQILVRNAKLAAAAARELGVTALRFFVLRHAVIPASRGGKAKTLNIEIKDNGTGFTSEVAKKSAAPFFTTRKGGEYATAVSTDSKSAGDAFLASAQFFAYAIQAAAYAATAIAVNWRLALLGLLSGAVMLAVFSVLLKTTKAAARVQWAQTGKLTTLMLDMLNNIKPIRRDEVANG